MTRSTSPAQAKDAGAAWADETVLNAARAFLAEQASALGALAGGLDSGFARAVELIFGANRLVVGGVGKSGHVGRKLAATFSSTGTLAHFLHLGEALHGDLGVIGEGDVALLISRSGESAELEGVIPYLGQSGVPLIAITANRDLALARAATASIALPPLGEAGPIGLAPTTSSLMTMAIGDALAMAVLQARGFVRQDFQRLHPSGALGHQIRPVSALMHAGEAMPLVGEATPMLEAIVEMTAKRLGVVGVVDGSGELSGVITDGDLRRHLAELADARAVDVMTRSPKVIPAYTLAGDARVLMHDHRITALFVVADPASRRPEGVVHIHDLPFAP
jgi:arabinose-5-phosphate isomerase